MAKIHSTKKKKLDVSFENQTFNTYHKNIFPKRCWTRFAEITTLENYKKI